MNYKHGKMKIINLGPKQFENRIDKELKKDLRRNETMIKEKHLQ